MRGAYLRSRRDFFDREEEETLSLSYPFCFFALEHGLLLLVVCVCPCFKSYLRSNPRQTKHIRRMFRILPRNYFRKDV